MHLSNLTGALVLCFILYSVDADQNQNPEPCHGSLHKGNYKQKEKEVRKAIKERGASWEASVNPEFDEIDDFLVLLGAEKVPNELQPRRVPPTGRKHPPKHLPKRRAKEGPAGRRFRDQSMHPTGGRDTDCCGCSRNNRRHKREAATVLPKSYDARTVYPECPNLGSIRYQYHCSSCWAQTAVSIISDRHCIYNANITGQLYFSPMQIISCLSKGCNGGKEWDAYEYWVTNGLVTGGTEYPPANQPLGCLPYPKGINDTPPACPTSCTSSPQGGNITFKDNIIKGGSWYNWISPPVVQIQEEIYHYGPVAAFFPCYEDLFYYKSGVYNYTYGKLVGYHLTKLIGWGTNENGTDYWTAVNTWGKKWGENGTFRILRGVNEVGIEERISGVMPIGAF